MKKLIATIVLFFSAAITLYGQHNNVASDNLTHVTGEWYESPAESKEDVIVFKKTKHINNPGVDVVGMQYTKLTLNNDKSCVLDFSKWCSNHVNHLEGTWSGVNSNEIKLNFGNNGCNTDLKIISISDKELKVQFKETK